MYTVGSYLAARLTQIGLKHQFAVAGDFNLVLLDELLKNKDLGQVYCCNEFNCGYAAEGYARACGAAALDRKKHGFSRHVSAETHQPNTTRAVV